MDKYTFIRFIRINRKKVVFAMVLVLLFTNIHIFILDKIISFIDIKYLTSNIDIVYKICLIIAGIVGVWLAIWRGICYDRQIKIQNENYITDRFIKLYETLYSKDIVQRMGAIEMLWRIANTSNMIDKKTILNMFIDYVNNKSKYIHTSKNNNFIEKDIELVLSKMQFCKQELSIKDPFSFNFHDINLSGGNFCSFRFENSILENINFTGAQFSHASFKGAHMYNCNFTNCYIDYAELEKASFTRCLFNKVRFDSSSCQYTHIYECDFVDCIFSKNMFYESKIYNSFIYKCYTIEDKKIVFDKKYHTMVEDSLPINIYEFTNEQLQNADEYDNIIFEKQKKPYLSLKLQAINRFKRNDKDKKIRGYSRKSCRCPFSKV